MSIAPSKTILNLKPGETWQGELQVAMEVPSQIKVYLNTADFRSSGEEGGLPFFYNDDSGPVATGLRRWIKVDPSSLVLDPGVYKFIPVSISVPLNATPGGHYGAVLLSPSPLTSGKDFSGAQIEAVIASLFIVQVEGDVSEQLSISEFYSDKDVFNGAPANFVLRLQNSGNTHISPYAVVEVFNEFGSRVGEVELNNPGLVLPQDIRRYRMAWGNELTLKIGDFEIPIGEPLAMGIYHAKLTLWYGDEQKVLQASDTFFVFPWIFAGVLVACAAVVLLLLRYLMHRYRMEVVVRRVMKTLGQGQK